MADSTHDTADSTQAWWWHPTVVGPLLLCLVLAIAGGYIWWSDAQEAKAESKRRTQELTCAMLIEDGQRFLPEYCFDS